MADGGVGLGSMSGTDSGKRSAGAAADPGVTAAFGFVRQPNLHEFFDGVLGMLSGMADEVQWVIWIGALLFIGYALRGRAKSDTEDD